MPQLPSLEIVVATGNRHKFSELVELFDGDGVRWRSSAEFPGMPPVRENGRTFAANAIKKAKATARFTGMIALADDSGIEVDALKGAPGIRSARFAGIHGDDAANNRKLLQSLEGLPRSRRTARYRCVLALAAPEWVIGTVEAVWAGVIAEREAGDGGFGYDPLFFLPKYGKTVAQLPRELKQRLSHRAKAARRLRPLLRQLAACAIAVTGRG